MNGDKTERTQRMLLKSFNQSNNLNKVRTGQRSQHFTTDTKAETVSTAKFKAGLTLRLGQSGEPEVS